MRIVFIQRTPIHYTVVTNDREVGVAIDCTALPVSTLATMFPKHTPGTYPTGWCFFTVAQLEAGDLRMPHINAQNHAHLLHLLVAAYDPNDRN